MNKLWMVAAVGTAMAAPSMLAAVVYDGSIAMSGSSLEWQQGGEFTANTGSGNFGTFCLEAFQDFALNNTYAYNVNSGAVSGGAGAVAGADTKTGLSMDNISIGTAYLYSQFRSGAIQFNTAQDAGNFQAAIWYLENEYNTLTPGNNSDGSYYYNLAKTGTGKNDTTVFEDSNGAYGVVALNLYSTTAAAGAATYATTMTAPGGSYATAGSSLYLNQDMLDIVVPEPTTVLAGALLLLPFGASTLRILRKRQAA